MKMIRPVQEDDLPSLFKMACNATVGITNLPKDLDLLKEKINSSQEAFSPEKDTPHHNLYLFVLEDLETKEIVGTSGIFAKTGVEEKTYFYHLEEEIRNHDLPHVPSLQKILRPVSYTNGPTEICGLYLLPEYRKKDAGRLLSYSRFLFIASFPRRFDSLVIAEMRGVIDEKGNSPFWEGIGRHFFNIDLKLALDLVSHSKKFIENILPSHPLYYALLPKDVQDVIEKVHPNTEPALQLLLKEGFSFSGDIDVFDGGPKISAFTHEIATIRESHIVKVEKVVPHLEAEESLISNLQLDFRATIAPLCLLSNYTVSLSKATADALGVTVGDSVRWSPPKAQ